MEPDIIDSYSMFVNKTDRSDTIKARTAVIHNRKTQIIKKTLNLTLLSLTAVIYRIFFFFLNTQLTKR